MTSCAKEQYSDEQVYFEPDQSEVTPIDDRKWIEASQFSQTGDGVWVSEKVESAFPYDELIYSWQISLAEDEAFEIYLNSIFPDGYESGWQFAGYWGDYKGPTDRSNPSFDRGTIYIDQLITKDKGDGEKYKATEYQFKVVSTGKKILSKLPDVRVITTNNNPSNELAGNFMRVYPMIELPQKVLDLPLRKQVSSDGERMKDTCQTASMATALEYLGDYRKNEDLFEYIYDEAYDYPGVWPRVTGVAAQLGYTSYVDRFRDWRAVEFAIADNKMILASIKMPVEGDYLSPPYPDIGGHIIVINGLTKDGRVLVTDSALGKDGTGYRCQWLIEDLEKIWMKNKGGVALVVEPKTESNLPVIENIEPFPREIPKESRHFQLTQN